MEADVILLMITQMQPPAYQYCNYGQGILPPSPTPPPPGQWGAADAEIRVISVESPCHLSELPEFFFFVACSMSDSMSELPEVTYQPAECQTPCQSYQRLSLSLQYVRRHVRATRSYLLAFSMSDAMSELPEVTYQPSVCQMPCQSYKRLPLSLQYVRRHVRAVRGYFLACSMSDAMSELPEVTYQPSVCQMPCQSCQMLPFSLQYVILYVRTIRGYFLACSMSYSMSELSEVTFQPAVCQMPCQSHQRLLLSVQFVRLYFALPRLEPAGRNSASIYMPLRFIRPPPPPTPPPIFKHFKETRVKNIYIYIYIYIYKIQELMTIDNQAWHERVVRMRIMHVN